MNRQIIYCSGPHIEPVALYVVAFSEDITQPRSPNALCAECASIYATALGEPPMIPIDGKEGLNPLYLRPGQLPTEYLVEAIKKRRIPNWVNPPNNYRETKGKTNG